MGREHHTEYSGHDLPVKMRGPGGQSVRLQWQQHHKLSGLERAETGAEGFRYDRHGNLLAYTDGTKTIISLLAPTPTTPILSVMLTKCALASRMCIR